jgi:N6-L-threonylcarbamoyladenine synthase/protein kinase Bud32
MSEPSKPLICLGIEGTAHTVGVGIVDSDGRVLANMRSEYIPGKGGIHPREAAEHHAMVAPRLVVDALKIARLAASDVHVVSFSMGPGLGPCLRVVATAARALSFLLGKPLVGVNHCLAHIEIGRRVMNVADPLTLYVSGGNTIVAAFDCGRYRVFGETLDIAVGNMLDAFGRDAGIPHPGGPRIEKLASMSKKFISLPYTVKGMDLSFSGLLTATSEMLKSGKHSIEDVCYSVQEVAFSMLAEVTERALAHTEKAEVLLTGGVAANKRLQQMISIVSNEHGASFYVVPIEYAGDNGAMIAWTGLMQFRAGRTIRVEESNVRPKWRLDEVDVSGRGCSGGSQ